MKTRSVDEQVAALRPSVVLGFAVRMHRWFLAAAAMGVIAAIVFWHPVPLMIAVFLGVVGFAERRAGPNIVAAIAAYDSGRSTPAEVSITISCWDMDNHYHAIVHERGWPNWEYEFVPQGWQPSAGTYPSRVWRDGASGRPVLAAVENGILIPRYDPEQRSSAPDGTDTPGDRADPA